MKRNSFKKVLAAAMAGAMVISGFAGCGSKDKTPQATEPTTAATTEGTTAKATEGTTASQAEATTAQATEPAPASGVASWTAFSDKVTLKVPVYDRGVEGVPTVNDNYWTKWIQENFGDKYNVTVEFVPITRTKVMEDYSLLAASKKLPTLLMEYDYPKLAQWANDGYLTTFDMDEFAQVAPTYYQKMVDNSQLVYSVMNDETYFTFAERPYYRAGYTFLNFVRMDWLKQIGYDYVPQKYSDWCDAMDKIMEAGIADHPAGGTMITGVGSDQNYAFRNFPMIEEEWAIYGDMNIPSLGWEPNYKLVKRENEKYNKGYLDPEYYIIDAETAKAAFINGETYQYGGYIAPEMDFLTAFYKQNPDAELALVPSGIVDEEGGTIPAYRADNPFGMIIGFSSFASEDEIKAAWMYMEWMLQEDNLFTMQWGIEGENYTVDAATGLPVSVADYDGDYKQGYNNSKDYWCVAIEARNSGTIEQIIETSAPKGLPQDFTQDIIKLYNDNMKLVEQGYAINDALFSVNLDEEGEYRGTLTELYKEYRDKLTMCKPEEFDALYEELTKKYNEAGYQAVVEERQAAYQNGSTTVLQDNQKAQ